MKRFLVILFFILFGPSVAYAINITVPQATAYGDVLRGNANGTYTPVATSTLGLSSASGNTFGYPFTPFPAYNGTSTAIGFSAGLFTNGSTTFAQITGTQCLHTVNGLLGGTGSDCGSGTGSLFPFTPAVGYNGTTTAFGITGGAGLFTTGSTTFSSIGTGAVSAVDGKISAGTLTVANGGTGQASFTAGNLIYGNGTGGLSNVATGTATCSGTVSCNPFTIVGSSVSIIGAGSATGLGTTSPWTIGQVAYVSSQGAVTSVATTSHAFSGPFTITGTIGALVGGSNSTVTWSGLATTSQPAASNLLVSNGLAGVYGVATSTLTPSAPLTGSFTQLGTTGTLGLGTVGYANGGTGSTTAPIGQVIYGGSTAYQSAPTSTPTIGSVLTYSGTLGNFIGGTSGTFSIANTSITNAMLVNSTISGIALGNNLAAHTVSGSITGTSYNGSAAVSDWALNMNNGNNWTALQTFARASSTQLSVTTKAYFGATATTTIDSAGNIVIPSGSSITNTGVTNGCGTWASGVLGSTGSACGAGGGAAFPFTPSATYNSTTTLLGLLAGASTTQLSVWQKAYFGATATSTFDSAGVLTLASALTVGNGGTGLSSVGDGQLVFGGAGGGTANLVALATSTGGFLTNSSSTGRPVWAATSTLNIAISDTTGTLSVARGGTGQTSFTAGNLIYGNASGALSNVATTTPTLGLGLAYSGTLGALVGGASGSLTIATSSLYSGSTGQFPYFSAANTITATSSLFLATSGFIGIGSTTPGSLLSLGGVANFGAATSTFYTAGGINITGGCFAINGTCLVNGTGGTETPVGSVDGINTVFTTTYSPVSVFVNGGYQTAGGIDYSLTGAGPYTITFVIPPTTSSIVRSQYATGAAGGSAVTSVSNADGTLTISPTTGAVVASIALGHANSWTALQQFNGQASSTQFSSYQKSYFGATATSSFDSAGNLTLAGLGTAAGAFLAVDATGKVISTTTPSGGGSGTVGSGTAGQFPYYAANGTALTATSSLFVSTAQNIGIGSTSPTSNLSVLGTAYISATTTIGTDNNSYLQIGNKPPLYGYLANDRFNVRDNRNDYSAGNIENDSSGACATADWTAANDLATNSTYFADLGHTSSGFTGIGCTNNPFTAYKGNDTYLFDPNGNIHFAIGSTSATAHFDYLSGGYAQSNIIETLLGNGNLGVGTTTPTATVSIDSTATSPTKSSLRIAERGSTIFDVASSSSTFLGVGTSSPWRTLSVVGTVAINGLTTSAGLQAGVLCISSTNDIVNDSVACLASAARFKNIQGNLTGALNELTKINPIVFTYKPEFNGSFQSNPNYNGEFVGFNADQVRGVDPRLVTIETSTTTGAINSYPGDTQGIKTDNILALTVEAVKELNAKVDGAKKSLTDNYQWLLIGLLFLIVGYQQVQIKRLKH